LSRLAIVPVMAAAFILFCAKTEAQQESVTANKSNQAHNPAKSTLTDKRVLVERGGWTRLSANYPFTKEGISPELMDEYIADEKKYARYLDISKIMTKPEELRMEQLYQQMSRVQQKTRVIFFEYPPPPMKGSAVSRADLNSWSDAAVYGIWVDGKRIKNAELMHHQPEEFNKIFFSRLTPMAVKNDKFHYQIELMTLNYYKKYREDAITNKHNSNIIFHIKS
ncbi:MAG: hypothetical protein M3N14_07670, partial [Bacteroidota bacterium]|nr:hypothetical protein [Bacteroidota bacterium]